MRRLFAATAALALLATACPAVASPQTRTWRIAVAGGQAVSPIGGDDAGYMSLLAHYGLPRARISEAELADLNRLKQFDVVIAAWGASGTAPAMQALEQFVADGGIAFTEGWPLPSTQVVAGRRLGPAPTANLRFVPSDSPISRGLPELGVVGAAGHQAGAIIPDAGSKAIVLARYTDENAPDKCRGHFPDGNQGAPAVLLIPYGKGHFIYSGPYVSPNLSPKGQTPEPLICRILDVLSNGEVRPRLALDPLDADSVVAVPPPPGAPPPYPTPPGAAQKPPEGFAALEEAAGLQDFCLSGTLPAAAPARVLLGYWSAGETDELAFADGKLTATRVVGGKAIVRRSAALPKTGEKLVVTRRQGLLTVALGDQPVLSACLGAPRQGALACSGLKDPAYQPLSPVNFDDDFMRESGAAGEWEAQSGGWSVVASEGKVGQGANPFNYQVSAGDEALTLAGNWFWSDYSVSAALQAASQAVGLVANYQAPDRYLLLKLAMSAQDPKASVLQLIQRRPAGPTVLAEAKVWTAATDWHRLELRTSRGRLQGLLNGQLVLQAAGEVTDGGRIGLYCQKGPAAFDDVRVRPWVASSPEPAPDIADAVLGGGFWGMLGGRETLKGSGKGGGRLLLPWPAVGDCRASVRVRLGQAETAGLLLRAHGESYVLVALVRNGTQLKLRASRRTGEGVVLGEKTVAGSPEAWHTISATYLGQRLQAAVDGKPLLSVLDAGPEAGAVGLYVRGVQAAQFQQLRAWQERAPERLVDQPTPSFAGIIDRHTWAGRSGAWTPDPSRLNCLWHIGYFPGDVRAEVGVHPTGQPVTTTLVHVSPGRQPGQGYTLQAVRSWSSDTVRLSLLRQGKAVAQGTGRAAAGKPYALCLDRQGGDLVARVGYRPAITYHDGAALADLDSLGLDNGGQPIHATDVAVSSTMVHDYTFETAPTDWVVESGVWKVSSRWSCSPGWSWFAGMDPAGPALVSTRETYGGDLDLVTYVGAKMMPAGETLTDIHLGLCAPGRGSEGGYHFVVGGQGNTLTALLREGKQVATSPYRISQAGIHNDWLRLTVRKRAARLALWAWDTPVLEWQDPEPLNGGRVSMGTFRNGVLIPRVTIYGRQASPPPVPETPEVAAPLPAAPAVAPAVTPPPAGVVAAKPASGVRQLFTFAQDQAKPEFGGDWGLWPKAADCDGTATWVAGQDAEGGAGGAMKVVYTIKGAPRSFSLWLTSGTQAVDFTGCDRFIVYARGDVPSFTLVVKDASAQAPDAPTGIADFVVKGLTGQWKRFEVSFKSFVPRLKDAKLNWGAINHIGIAMVAPANAEAGTFWVDNLRVAPPAAKKLAARPRGKSGLQPTKAKP